MAPAPVVTTVPGLAALPHSLHSMGGQGLGAAWRGRPARGRWCVHPMQAPPPSSSPVQCRVRRSLGGAPLRAPHPTCRCCLWPHCGTRSAEVRPRTAARSIRQQRPASRPWQQQPASRSRQDGRLAGLQATREGSPPQRRLSPASSLCTLPGPRQHPGRWCSASRWCRYQMRRCLHGAPATRRGLRGALSVPLRLHSSASQAAAQAHGSAAVRPPAAQPGALGAGQAGSPTSQQPLLPAGGEAGCWLLIGAHPCAPRQSWCSCRRARRPGWP